MERAGPAAMEVRRVWRCARVQVCQVRISVVHWVSGRGAESTRQVDE